MARVTVKVKSPDLKRLKTAATNASFTSQVALSVINEMKRFIRIGTSPVMGFRRFDPYKDKKKYPGDRKNSRPVNLELTGQMLNAITYKVLSDGVRIGIFDRTQADKARTHMEGLNGVPERRFMPIAEGEKFIVSIQRMIRDLYARKLSVILKG